MGGKKRNECKGGGEGADGNDDAASSGLWRAIKHGRPQEVSALLDAQPTAAAKAKLANARNKSGESALQASIAATETAMIEALLAAGADPNMASLRGRRETPLTAACWAGDDVAVQLLLRHGAKLSAANGDGRTPLHVAVLGGHCEIALLLLTGVDDPMLYDHPEELLRAMQGDASSADPAEGAKEEEDAAAKVREGRTPRIMRRSVGEVVLLLGARCNEGTTPLHLVLGELGSGTNFAVLGARLLGLLRAIEAASDSASREAVVGVVNAPTRDGRTPLHFLALSGCATPAAAELAEILLALGADPLAADAEGDDALMLCCEHQREPRVVRALLDDLHRHSRRDDDGAVAEGAGGLVLRKNAKDGSTALHRAVAVGNADMVEALLAAVQPTAAELDAKDNSGATALAVALLSPKGGAAAQSCVDALVRRGASRAVADAFVEAQQRQRGRGGECSDASNDDAGSKDAEAAGATGAGGDFSGHGPRTAEGGAPRPRGARRPARARPPAGGGHAAKTGGSSAAANDSASDSTNDAAAAAREGPGFVGYFVAITIFLSFVLPALDWFLNGSARR